MPSLSERMQIGRPAQQHKRILFVDDEAGIRATLPAILRKHGFQVSVASSVSEAIGEIEKQDFELLLCDLNIETSSDGYDVVRAMRRAHPECATIVLTGYPGLESAVEGIHLQLDDYLIKPSNADELVALLAQKLASKQPKARILSVSSDEVLLATRHLLLEHEGYEVISMMGLAATVEKCKDGGFDLFVLGHSIDCAEKRKMVEAFRVASTGPVISLRRSAGDELVDGAEYHIDPDPESLLMLIAQIVEARTAPKQVVTTSK